MTDKFDIDPQEVLMRAYQNLEAGWVRGAYHVNTPGNRGGLFQLGGGEDPVGHCLMGSLDKAVGDILESQILVRMERPVDTPEEKWISDIRMVVNSMKRPVVDAFGDALKTKIPASYNSVPGFNDDRSRTKAEVLELMRSVIEHVMLEQLAEVDKVDVPPLYPTTVEDVVETPVARLKTTVG